MVIHLHLTIIIDINLNTSHLNSAAGSVRIRCSSNTTCSEITELHSSWGPGGGFALVTRKKRDDIHPLSDLHQIYEGRLKSSWTHIIPSRNYVEVRWRSLIRSTSLGKRCTSYNAPHTSRKRAGERLPQASGRWNRRFWPFTIVSPSPKRFQNLKTADRLVSIGLMDEL